MVSFGPGERELADQVVGAAGDSRPVLLEMNIPQLMAVLRRAKFFVAGDTGPLHLASALGTPVVGLFGPTDPARNGPYGAEDIVVRNARPEETTYERGTSHSAAMLSITVQQVMEAVEREIEAGVVADRNGFLARWRVRLGYPLAPLYLWLALPTVKSLGWGMAIALLGLLLRGVAAGHLHKQEELTVSGPYAWTRNPLYFGSFLLVVGFAVASHSWVAAGLIVGYYAIFYPAVMRREEGELRRKHGQAFEEYAAQVPLFFPRAPRMAALRRRTRNFFLGISMGAIGSIRRRSDLWWG